MLSLPSKLEPVKMKSLKSRISALSGVEKVTACYASPGAGNSQWGTSVTFNNKPEAEEFNIQAKLADKNYLNTFNLKLIAGRNFYEKESVDEVVVNATFAKKVGVHSPEELLGKSINLSKGYIQGTIVGVIDDFYDQDFHNNINAIFIAPENDSYNELAIKINMNNVKSTLAYIEEQWIATFPNFIFEYDFLNDRVAKLYESEQRFLSLTKLFSALAIFIGCLGIYGLILFFVVQKTKEIGIRKVLGGSIFHILSLVTQDFLKLIAIAGLVASPLAWYFMNQWLQDYTYKTQLSWWIFALAIVIVVVITLLTISYQSIKAAIANPIKSLRTE
jgi:ABC-type antimicrobial peptide transport system permease subunit